MTRVSNHVPRTAKHKRAAVLSRMSFKIKVVLKWNFAECTKDLPKKPDAVRATQAKPP